MKLGGLGLIQSLAPLIGLNLFNMPFNLVERCLISADM